MVTFMEVVKMNVEKMIKSREVAIGKLEGDLLELSDVGRLADRIGALEPLRRAKEARLKALRAEVDALRALR